MSTVLDTAPRYPSVGVSRKVAMLTVGFFSNFIGEKLVRRVAMQPGVEVEISKNQKDELVLLGNDLENVSQSAADIQQICKVRNKDIRKVRRSPLTHLLTRRPRRKSLSIFVSLIILTPDATVLGRHVRVGEGQHRRRGVNGDDGGKLWQ